MSSAVNRQGNGEFHIVWRVVTLGKFAGQRPAFYHCITQLAFKTVI